MRDLPSLTALRAFETAARCGSFTLAARELGMSQAAVSYQIKRLETQLGLTLFVRRNRRIALTADGERIARPMIRAFDLMEDGLRRSESGSTLSITTTSSLASMWLIPRLGSFQEQHPDIQLTVSALNDIRDIESGEYDMGIRLGRGDWAPLVSEKLFDIRFTPMCSPTFLRSVGGAPTVADLPALPLIAQDDRRWNIWFADAGYPDLERVRGLRIVNQSEVIAAACAGQGFGLGIPFFAAPYLENGSLLCPFEQFSTDDTAYWLVYERSRRADRRIVAFRRWLLAALDDKSGV